MNKFKSFIERCLAWIRHRKVKNKSVQYWTAKELRRLPLRGWNEDVGQFTSLVILPTKRLHDSGYWCMELVAVNNGKPFMRMTMASDVIHLDGSGGYGSPQEKTIQKYIAPKGWRIDCLKVSRLLHVFSDHYLEAGPALSSFDLYSVLGSIQNNPAISNTPKS